MTDEAAERFLKEQRDRFLAFSFAGADLFIEANSEGTVTFTIGAAKGVTGIDEKTLMGKKWLELFSVYEQAKLIDMSEKAKPGVRCGPLLLNLSDALGARKAIFTAIKMPGRDKLYIALGVTSAIMSRISHALESHAFAVLNKDEFIPAAQSAFSRSRMMGVSMALSFVDFAPTALDRKRMGETAWKKLRETLGEYLISESAQGATAGEAYDGRFCLVHDVKLTNETLKENVAGIINEADPTKQGVTLKCKSLPIDYKNLGERETEKAVNYALEEFFLKGADLSYSTMNAAYEAYLNANNSQIKELKSIIERTGFTMHFQPVVDFKSNEPRYYEMLCRFERGDTGEWVKFAEDVALIAEFDLAVVERAINNVKFKMGGTRTKFSMNLSAQSVEKDDFAEKFMEMLTKEKALAERLIFEISNSGSLRDLKKAEQFISRVQGLGFKICLDNFRDGPLMSDMLNKLHPDSVKIAGHHIKPLLTVKRDVAVVKNIIDACKPINIDVIGESVEDKGQASVLRDLGADAAQGYYFGRPSSKVEYAPPRDWS